MCYAKMLNKQKLKLAHNIQWWPDYFYHFTDVHNAASIIKHGWIYSRADAVQKDIMENDNASKVVISKTDHENTFYGRLYFRPQTPTQYHNEGYKPPAVRNDVINASCPVPVFFLLSSKKVMELPDVKFAERGLAGNRNDIREGIREFQDLKFEKIYHDGYFHPLEERDIAQYRQSEIIRKEGFPLKQSVRAIVCRSSAERETLLHLLAQESAHIYNAYKRIIMFKPSRRMFFNNGIFIKNVNVVNHHLVLQLNSKDRRIQNGLSDIPFNVLIKIAYFSKEGNQIFYEEGNGTMNYCNLEQVTMRLEKSEECDRIGVEVLFDECVMYENMLNIREILV